MIRINCPFCGERDHSEFTYGGDGSIVYPALDASAEAWHDAVYLRENIRGMQTETWHHANGCRMWLVVERNTMTHEIKSVKAAHEGMGAAISVQPTGQSDTSVSDNAETSDQEIMPENTFGNASHVQNNLENSVNIERATSLPTSSSEDEQPGNEHSVNPITTPNGGHDGR